MTITEFLEARIAEDEAVANAAVPGSWEVGENPDYGFEEGIWDNSEPVNDIVCMRNYPEDGKDWPRGRHIARHDPARVLAECAAKRAIINNSADAQPGYMDDPHWNGFNDCHESALYALAAVYKDHPDYDPRWAA